MRLIFGAALLVVFGTGGAKSATIIGPTSHICREVMADKAGLTLSLMWVAGYVSGVNNLTKVDFLKGKDFQAVADRFRQVCLESPDKNMLEVARSVVAQLRMDLLDAR
jgi:hypothetical protein